MITYFTILQYSTIYSTIYTIKVPIHLVLNKFELFSNRKFLYKVIQENIKSIVQFEPLPEKFSILGKFYNQTTQFNQFTKQEI